MAVRVASAEWKGNLPKGSGTLETETGAVKGNYSFASRFEEGAGTNPEELIAAAHAGCFSMAFANGLAKAGFEADSIRTTAKAYLEKGPDGFGISRIELECVGKVPDIDEATFQEHAEGAKAGCPVSRALAATPIELSATLEG
jgi:osmotically inducible protein OsmC